MAQRDQLVTKRDVDVADASRVRLEIERRERSEGRGHVRHRDQFGDGASWPPAAPGRAALRRAGEDAQPTQRHVEPVLAPRAGGNLRQIVVGDLFKRAVASRDQHAETDGRRLCLGSPGSSMGSTRSRSGGDRAPGATRDSPAAARSTAETARRPATSMSGSRAEPARGRAGHPSIVRTAADHRRRASAARSSARSGPTELAGSDRDTPPGPTEMPHSRHASAAVRRSRW